MKGRTWPAYGAAVWGVLFALVHLYWALGGRAGLPADVSVKGSTPLLVISIVAVPLCLAAAVLALALVRPFGRIVGDSWLLAGAWAAAALMIVHAAPAVVVATQHLLDADAGALTPEERYSWLLYEPYWLLGGGLFVLTALSGRSTSDPRSPRG